MSPHGDIIIVARHTTFEANGTHLARLGRGLVWETCGQPPPGVPSSEARRFSSSPGTNCLARVGGAGALARWFVEVQAGKSARST